MTNPPLFSIITITYNNIDGLKRTQKSIQAQTTSNFEWIIIDGASTDGTPNYLSNTNANWLSQPDHGIYSAMNKGIKRAKGTFLIFLNAGDLFAKPHTLEKITTAINTTKSTPCFIYGNAIENIKGKLFSKPAKDHENILDGMFTHHQAMLYNRESLGTLRYNQDYDIAADYDLTLRFLKLERRKTLRCKFPICIFEAGGVSQTSPLKGRAEQFFIRQNLNVPPARNLMTFFMQSLSWSLRKIFPKAYWYLKKKQK